MAMLGKIRRLYYRDGLSINEIRRRTSLSRNTIKKWLKGPVSSAPKYRRRGVATKLTAFMAVVRQALEADSHRPKRERRTARALHAQLKV